MKTFINLRDYCLQKRDFPRRTIDFVCSPQVIEKALAKDGSNEQKAKLSLMLLAHVALDTSATTSWKVCGRGKILSFDLSFFRFDNVIGEFLLHATSPLASELILAIQKNLTSQMSKAARAYDQMEAASLAIHARHCRLAEATTARYLDNRNKENTAQSANSDVVGRLFGLGVSRDIVKDGVVAGLDAFNKANARYLARMNDVWSKVASAQFQDSFCSQMETLIEKHTRLQYSDESASV